MKAERFFGAYSVMIHGRVGVRVLNVLRFVEIRRSQFRYSE